MFRLFVIATLVFLSFAQNAEKIYEISVNLSDLNDLRNLVHLSNGVVNIIIDFEEPEISSVLRIKEPFLKALTDLLENSNISFEYLQNENVKTMNNASLDRFLAKPWQDYFFVVYVNSFDEFEILKDLKDVQIYFYNFQQGENQEVYLKIHENRVHEIENYFKEKELRYVSIKKFPSWISCVSDILDQMFFHKKRKYITTTVDSENAGRILNFAEKFKGLLDVEILKVKLGESNSMVKIRVKQNSWKLITRHLEEQHLAYTILDMSEKKCE